MIDKFLAAIIIMSSFCQLSTWWAINTNVGIEINPFVAWRLSNPILFFVPSIIFWFFIITYYNYLKKDNKKIHKIFKYILLIVIGSDFIGDLISTIMVLMK